MVVSQDPILKHMELLRSGEGIEEYTRKKGRLVGLEGSLSLDRKTFTVENAKPRVKG